MRARAARLLLVAASLSSASCTAITSLDAEQCMTDADCTARGAEFQGTVCIEKTCRTPPPEPDPVWGCVGNVPAPSTDPYTANIVVADAITQKPVPDASAKLCSKLDPTCETPIQQLTLAADGSASFTIPSNAYDYVMVTSPDHLPTMYFVDPASGNVPLRVSLLTAAAQAALNQTLGVTADPMEGSLNISAYDCRGMRAKGVALALDPLENAIPYYTISSSPSTKATETDIVGNGGFINVKPGVVTLSAKLASTGQTIASVTTLSAAGMITFQPIRPTILP